LYYIVIAEIAMPELISLRLADDLLSKLEREATRSGRGRSEIVRDAVTGYLAQLERDRFLAEIARAARARGPDEALALAGEALPFDNEALGLLDMPAVQDVRGSYRTKPRKRR
jgi:predicted DNA-binding protein